MKIRIDLYRHEGEWVGSYSVKSDLTDTFVDAPCFANPKDFIKAKDELFQRLSAAIDARYSAFVNRTISEATEKTQ